MSGYGGGRGGGRGTGEYGYSPDDYSGYDGGQGQGQGKQRRNRSSWDDPAARQASPGDGYGGGRGHDQGGQGQYPRTGGQQAQRRSGPQPTQRGSGPQPTQRGSGGQQTRRGSGTGPRPAQRGMDPWATDLRGAGPRGTGPRRAAGRYEDERQSSGYRQSGGYGQGDWDSDGDDSFLPGFGRRDQGGRYDDGYGDRRDPRGRDPRSGGPRDNRGPAGRRPDGWDRDPRGRGGRDDRDREAWPQYHSAKRKRGVVRRLAPWVALLIIVVPIIVGGLYVYHRYEARYHPPDYVGAGTGDVTFEVRSGDTAFSIAPRLLAADVIGSDRAFTNAAEAASTGSPGLEAGFFLLHHHMQASLAYAALTNPKNRVQTTVTIPEGKRVSQILMILAKYTKIPLAQFQAAAKDTAALGLPSYAGSTLAGRKLPAAVPYGKLEGYLFPATYAIVPHETALQILRAMVSRFNVEAQAINIVKAGKSVGLTPTQLIIEASIVQAEAGRTADFTKIAEVISNRLKDGMLLGMDSTVFYGLDKYGTRATSAELAIPNPYSTYAHLGLPPGPIDSPGALAINAVLHPAHGNLTWFIGCTNGKSLFATSQAGLGTC